MKVPSPPSRLVGLIGHYDSVVEVPHALLASDPGVEGLNEGPKGPEHPGSLQ